MVAGPIYEIEEYVDRRGISPFGRWLLGLKDKRTQAKLLARVRRASFGNFGDSKPIQGVPGLREMREHSGPGYRVYDSIEGRKVVLLLAGSDKRRQRQAIAAAAEYLQDYRRRRQS